MRRIPGMKVLAASVLLCTVGVTPSWAQLNTQHLKGAVGLKAGSQPPPHVYLIAPLVYVYSADRVNDRNGNALPIDGSITSALFGPGVSVVTSKMLLGAHYGFQVLLPLGANNRIEATEIDLNPGAGLTDTVVQPISLGWSFKRADAIAGYIIYMPTGRYTSGANDNTGLGMWGQEVSFGTTVYLNEARQFHIATLATFNFQSKKEDSQTQVGTAMNLEGGAGVDFLQGGLTVGLAYSSTFKLTADQIEGLPGILIRGKNRAVALGPEVSLALARKGVLYGLVRMTYQWEVYTRTTTQGSLFSIAASFPIKPIKLPTP